MAKLDAVTGLHPEQEVSLPFPENTPEREKSSADTSAPDDGVRSLVQRISRLERRLERLEQMEGLPSAGEDTTDGEGPGQYSAPLVTAGALESQIGELWLARVGVVALIVGLGFLVTYPFATLAPYISCLLGYASVLGFLVLAYFWRNSQPDASRLLFGGALFLVYFATLRLHFFAPHPTLPSRTLALGLLVAVLAGQYYVAYRRRSELTAALVAVLGFVTSVVSDTPNFSLGLVFAGALVALWFYHRLNWLKLTLFAMALSYLMHLLWLVNNPLVGHPFRGVVEPRFNLMILAGYAVVFALAGLVRPQNELPFMRILRAGGNSVGVMLIGLMNVQLFHRQEAHWLLLGLAAAFLAVAIIYWQHHRGQYGTAIYACFGYMALSAAIFSWFSTPAHYGWLAWQSLLVAATAVWFRSKIIIVANLFIFGGIYLTYFALAPATGWVNLSFALVALLIARILHWRQQQLEVRTEIMRNTYLAAATIIIPYGLYHTVPESLVSTSWLAAAVLYFLADRVLGIRKYRWMAMATILATIIYVFSVDLSRLEPAYRILSFLILGVVLLVISVFYTRQRRRSQREK